MIEVKLTADTSRFRREAARAQQAVTRLGAPPPAERLTASRLEQRLIAPLKGWALRAVYLARLERAGVRPAVAPVDSWLYGPGARA